MPLRDIALHLGRSLKSVQRRAYDHLGLSTFRRRVWTAEEDAIIRDSVEGRLAELAQRLGRRESEVSTRARRLGLQLRKPARFQSRRDGYIELRGRGGSRWAHIEVVEQRLGRKLVKPELVHHVNTIKSDNRSDNLWLCPDRASHLRAHRSLEYLLPQLLERGVVRFDHSEGVYRLCETDS